MTFANPMLFAIGMAAISLPIIIHFLMRRRRKPIAWAAMRFLLEAYRQQRRRMRLEQLLLLAVRCLLVGLIGVAVGRPMLRSLGVLGSGSSTTLVIVLDNSLTSQVTDAKGETSLERHKKQADGLLATLRPGSGDRAALITLGGPAESVVWPASADVPAVRRAVEGVIATDSAADLAGGLKVLSGAASAGLARDAGGRLAVAVLSDFYDGSVNLRDRLTAISGEVGGPEVTVLASRPAATAATNTAVLGVEAQRGLIVGPQPVLATANLRRTGAMEEVAQPVHFRLIGMNGEVLSQARASVRWKRGQQAMTASATLDAPEAGNAAAILTASVDASGIRGDDVARRVLERRTNLRVAVIAPRREGVARSIADYSADEWILTALVPERTGEGEVSRIEASLLEPTLADASRLANQDAIVLVRPDLADDALWDRVRAHVERGGLAVVTAPATDGAHTWTDPMLRALPTGWVIDREAKASATGVGLARERGSEIPRDVLAPLAPELTALGEPVRVFRWLGIKGGDGETRGGASLALADGSPWVIAAGIDVGARGGAASGATTGMGRGLVVLVASAISFDWTNLPAKPLFPALMQDVIRQGVGLARGQWMSVAGSVPTVPVTSVQLAPVGSAPGIGGGVVGVGDGGRASGAIRRAGLWRATDRSGATSGLVVVSPDHAAGSVQPNNATDVQAWLASLGNAGTGVRLLDESGAIASDAPSAIPTAEAASGLRWGLWCMLAALVLAVIEVALSRWFSHATTPPASGGTGAGA